MSLFIFDSTSFRVFLEARPEILTKISLVFWSIWRHQKDISKLTDLACILPYFRLYLHFYVVWVVSHNLCACFLGTKVYLCSECLFKPFNVQIWISYNGNLGFCDASRFFFKHKNNSKEKSKIVWVFEWGKYSKEEKLHGRKPFPKIL